MKKILAMLLAVIMCISMTACGGGNSKEKEAELVASTPMLDLDELWYSMYANEASAKLNYDGKMFQVRVTVLNIGTNSFEYVYKDDNGFTHYFEVYLPTETLATLTSGEHITVLGKLKLSSSGSASLRNAFIVDETNSAQMAVDDETVQEIIADYCPDKTNPISWDNGSCPFLVENRMSFEQITESDFMSKVEGQWIGKHYVDTDESFYIEFTSTSSANITTEDNVTKDWPCQITGDTLTFSKASHNEYEVRKLSDKLIVFYGETIDFVPMWILYKE